MCEHGTKTTSVFLPADGEASWSKPVFLPADGEASWPSIKCVASPILTELKNYLLDF